MTFAELGRRLKERWPGYEGDALAQTVRAALPLVQVPPRGVWGKSGLARHLPLDNWVEGARLPSPALGVDELVLRYFGSFGPASVMDAQAWCGLTRLAEVVDRLRPRLVAFRDDGGRELFDLRDAPRPPEDTPAPSRFLPDFDNLLVSYTDRSRMGRHNYATRNGQLPGTVLVDGFIRATWVAERSGKDTVLAIRALEPLSSSERDDIEHEGRDLLALMVMPGSNGETRFLN